MVGQKIEMTERTKIDRSEEWIVLVGFDFVIKNRLNVGQFGLEG